MNRDPNRARPWIAFVLPFTAWFVFQQAIGGPLHIDCVAGRPWLGPLWGGLSLLICAVAAWIAWPQARVQGEGIGGVVCWLARVALLSTGVFALAILFQTLATLIVPSCAR
ncbi:MAG TPA: hypothetical protein VFL92_10395 [Sphingomonas sp.]|nr:hypothetical protein [Sphingomonas sp.]